MTVTYNSASRYQAVSAIITICRLVPDATDYRSLLYPAAADCYWKVERRIINNYTSTEPAKKEAFMKVTAYVECGRTCTATVCDSTYNGADQE